MWVRLLWRQAWPSNSAAISCMSIQIQRQRCSRTTFQPGQWAPSTSAGSWASPQLPISEEPPPPVLQWQLAPSRRGMSTGFSGDRTFTKQPDLTLPLHAPWSVVLISCVSHETCYMSVCFKTFIPVPPKNQGSQEYMTTDLSPSVVIKSFTYRCVDDAANMALHVILQHLDTSGHWTVTFSNQPKIMIKTQSSVWPYFIPFSSILKRAVFYHTIVLYFIWLFVIKTAQGLQLKMS